MASVLRADLAPQQAIHRPAVTEALQVYAAIDEHHALLLQQCFLPLMRAVSPDADIVTEVIGEVVGLVPAEPNEAKAILMELTGANGADTVPFGTEAGIFQSLGMSAVICGPGSIEQAHKPDEFLAVDQLDQCLAMLDRLSERLKA